MRYSVKSMDSVIPTISASASGAVSVRSLQIENEAPTSHATSGNASITGEAQGTFRWQNSPGIRVSLQSQDLEPQIDEYRRLRSDGCRKDSTMTAEPENIHRIIEAEQFAERSVNPRTKVILDNFIQQMGGIEQPMSSGSHINTSV